MFLSSMFCEPNVFVSYFRIWNAYFLSRERVELDLSNNCAKSQVIVTATALKVITVLNIISFHSCFVLRYSCLTVDPNCNTTALDYVGNWALKYQDTDITCSYFSCFFTFS